MVGVYYDRENMTAHFDDPPTLLKLPCSHWYIETVDDEVVDSLIENGYLNHDVSHDMLKMFIKMVKTDLKK